MKFHDCLRFSARTCVSDKRSSQDIAFENTDGPRGKKPMSHTTSFYIYRYVFLSQFKHGMMRANFFQ